MSVHCMNTSNTYYHALRPTPYLSSGRPAVTLRQVSVRTQEPLWDLTRRHCSWEREPVSAAAATSGTAGTCSHASAAFSRSYDTSTGLFLHDCKLYPSRLNNIATIYLFRNGLCSVDMTSVEMFTEQHIFNRCSADQSEKSHMCKEIRLQCKMELK